MAQIFTNYLLPVALAAVAVVLLFGLWNMMRGGNPNTSQKLMRWRVGLQFVAICIAMVAVWLMSHK
jgi:NADH:ubiquinone oxidoreductase subunit 6 (subunit J)